MSLTPRLAKLVRIAAAVVVVVLLWLFLRELDWGQLASALRHAEIWPLLVSSALYFACLFGKALSWRFMLAPHHVVSVGRLYRYTIAAFAASALVPARAGELVRVWALKRRDDVPVADSTAVAIAEKLLEAITLLLVCAPVPWLVPGLPAWVTNAMLVCAGIAFGVLLGLFVAVGRTWAREPHSWFGRFIAGMHVIRDPRRLALAIVTLLVTWVADLTAVMFVMHAVDVDISIPGGLFVLLSFNLAIAIPSTPAQIGALQVGALAATTLLNIPEERGLAFALLYQAAQIIPLLLVGLVFELDLVRGRMPTGPEPAS